MRNEPSASTCTTTTSSSGGGGTLSVEDWGTNASRPTEYFGMIIKITRSTSKISISGTTFISETIPRLPPTDIPMIHLVWLKCPARRTLTSVQSCEKLLTGFEFGGDQTNLVDTSTAHDVHGTGNFHKHYIVVPFTQPVFLRPPL